MGEMMTMSYEKLFLEMLILIVIALWATMQWHGKLPTIDSVGKLAGIINSRGGNIMVLGSFSLFFFVAALRFTYWTMSLAVDGKIDMSQTIATAAFTWITGSAFGGAFTSMVKAMTGEDTKARSTDAGPGGRGTMTVTAPIASGNVQLSTDETKVNGAN